MICPKCGAEYIPGVTVCYDCDVALVEGVPTVPPSGGPPVTEAAAAPQSPDAALSLVTVYVASDPGLLAIAETMLESAGIPHLVEGARHYGVFGGPLGLHVPQGPAFLRVASQDAADAREVLADLSPEG